MGGGGVLNGRGQQFWFTFLLAHRCHALGLLSLACAAMPHRLSLLYCLCVAVLPLRSKQCTIWCMLTQLT